MSQKPSLFVPYSSRKQPTHETPSQSQDEGDATLLDRSTILSTSNLDGGPSHSNRDLPVLLAGRFKHCQHPGFAPSSTPLCDLFGSVLNQLGMDDNSFGTSISPLTGLELG
jgi:hypothetical protein